MGQGRAEWKQRSTYFLTHLKLVKGASRGGRGTSQTGHTVWKWLKRTSSWLKWQAASGKGRAGVRRVASENAHSALQATPPLDARMRATRRLQKWAVQVATFVRLPSCWFCSPVSGFLIFCFWGPPTTSSYELVQLSFKAKLRIMYYNILCRGCCSPLPVSQPTPMPLPESLKHLPYFLRPAEG